MLPHEEKMARATAQLGSDLKIGDGNKHKKM